jgi:hypothetical protein
MKDGLVAGGAAKNSRKILATYLKLGKLRNK